MRDDLMAAYREVAPKCWTQMEAWEKTVKHPAPRYYISQRQALQRLMPMTRGDFSAILKMKPSRQRLYFSLFERVRQMSQLPEYADMSLYRLIPYALLSGAPEFFITPGCMEVMYPNYKKYGRSYKYLEIYGKNKKSRKEEKKDDKRDDKQDSRDSK